MSEQVEPSRSKQKQEAAMRGEPTPTFSGQGLEPDDKAIGINRSTWKCPFCGGYDGGGLELSCSGCGRSAATPTATASELSDEDLQLIATNEEPMQASEWQGLEHELPDSPGVWLNCGRAWIVPVNSNGLAWEIGEDSGLPCLYDGGKISELHRGHWRPALSAQGDKARVEDNAIAKSHWLYRKMQAALAASEAKVRELEATLEREGYRRCDIAACNCGGWHGGSAGERLRELKEVLDAAGCQPMQKTILVAVKDLIANVARLTSELEEARESLMESRPIDRTWQPPDDTMEMTVPDMIYHIYCKRLSQAVAPNGYTTPYVSSEEWSRIHEYFMQRGIEAKSADSGEGGRG